MQRKFLIVAQSWLDNSVKIFLFRPSLCKPMYLLVVCTGTGAIFLGVGVGRGGHQKGRVGLQSYFVFQIVSGGIYHLEFETGTIFLWFFALLYFALNS